MVLLRSEATVLVLLLLIAGLCLLVHQLFMKRIGTCIILSVMMAAAMVITAIWTL
jgi:hypothetical protein